MTHPLVTAALIGVATGTIIVLVAVLALGAVDRHRPRRSRTVNDWPGWNWPNRDA